MKFCFFLLSPSKIIGTAPLTPFNSPFKESSPNTIYSSNDFSSICPDTINIPSAIGRSRRLPIFFTSAGAKFIVILPNGNSYPLFTIANLTLSLDSLIDVSGNPTILKLGIPLVISTSTLINTPSNPLCVALVIFKAISYINPFLFSIFLFSLLT